MADAPSSAGIQARLAAFRRLFRRATGVLLHAPLEALTVLLADSEARPGIVPSIRQRARASWTGSKLRMIVTASVTGRSRRSGGGDVLGRQGIIAGNQELHPALMGPDNAHRRRAVRVDELKLMLVVGAACLAVLEIDLAGRARQRLRHGMARALRPRPDVSRNARHGRPDR